MTTALVLSLLLQAAAPAARPADPFEAVRFLLGDWKGESDGDPGKGTVERSYRLVLGNRFIHEQNVSSYPPQAKNPKGERHEHWSLVSYDRGRRSLVLRQFHQEGFVNQYLAAPPGPEGRIVFDSEALENVPAGWKARETYEVVSGDEFVETFEIASDGKTFAVYSRARFRRAHP